jgi:HEPN domain-containing protein
MNVDWYKIQNPIKASCVELLSLANRDIRDILSQIKDEEKPDYDRHSKGSYCANQAVEKLLKAFIRDCNRDVPYGHNLVKYLEGAVISEPAFAKLENHCKFLDSYSGERYNPNSKIDAEDFRDTINAIKSVYLFEKISILFDKHSNNVEKIPDAYFDRILETYENTVNKKIPRPITCINYKFIDNYNPNLPLVDTGVLFEYEKIDGILPEGYTQGHASKKVFEVDKRNMHYILERVFKKPTEENYKSDIFKADSNFTQLDAFYFIKDAELKMPELIAAMSKLKRSITNKKN